MDHIREMIAAGRTALGIELGSTRIKAVLIGEDSTPIAAGSHEWENRLENGVWTYTLDDVWTGLRHSYAEMAADVERQYGVKVERIGSMGFSAMMHGYMAFDEGGKLLVPFRTWRNTMTEAAAQELTELFHFNIPQRWSIAHLYQAILNGEEHVPAIRFLTTLAGYVHWQLSGEKVLGVGEASGMFPIDSTVNDYDPEMMAAFDAHIAVDSPGSSGTFCPVCWWPARWPVPSPKRAPACWTPPEPSSPARCSAPPRGTRAPAWWPPTACGCAPAMCRRAPASLP